MNAEGAFDALWGYLRTLWRLARERFTLMIWSCALVEIGWSLLWAAALGLIALPLCRPAVPDHCRLSSDGFRTTQTAKTASGKISPLWFFSMASWVCPPPVSSEKKTCLSNCWRSLRALSLLSPRQPSRSPRIAQSRMINLEALRASVKPSGGPGNGGLDNNEWAVVVARDGTVCAVAFSGGKADDQWPGSRAVAAEKANTANAFSLKSFALSTANLYASAQPAVRSTGRPPATPSHPKCSTAAIPRSSAAHPIRWSENTLAE